MNVTVYMNTDPNNFDGYKPHHALATDDDLTLLVNDEEEAFVVGNRMGADLNGKTWPSDVRSVSVGDVIHIHPDSYVSIERFGFKEIPTPDNIVPLAGHGRVTSR